MPDDPGVSCLLKMYCCSWMLFLLFNGRFFRRRLQMADKRHQTSRAVRIFPKAGMFPCPDRMLLNIFPGE